MHFTYLFPFMDEAAKWLEYVTIPCQRLPTGYRQFSLDIPLEVKVVDSVSSEVDPTLPSKSEFQVVNLDSFVIDPILPLKSEVQVVDQMSSPPNPTLSSENVETEVVPSTQSSSSPSLLIESETHLAEVLQLVPIVLCKQKFCLFRQNHLQVVSLFPLTGVT